MKTLAFNIEAVNWVRDRMIVRPEWPDAIGLAQYSGDEIVAAVVYEDFTQRNVNMHVAFATPHGPTAAFYVNAFTYPFVTIGLARVTGFVPAKNEAALRLDLKLGFQVEGRIRQALPDDDIILLGMLKEECRFIRRT